MTKQNLSEKNTAGTTEQPPKTEETAGEASGATTSSNTSRAKMWLGLAAVVGILLLIGGLRWGTLSGRATGEGSAMGCGGSPMSNTSTDNTTDQTAVGQRSVVPKLPGQSHIPQARVLSLPQLLKKIAEQRKLALANKPTLQPSPPQGFKHPEDNEEAKALPLPQLLEQLKMQRLQREQNPPQQVVRSVNRLDAHTIKPQVLPLPELLKKLQANKTK